MRIVLPLLLALALSPFQSSLAQKRWATLSGRVLNENEAPLGTVSVVILGKQSGTVTRTVIGKTTFNGNSCYEADDTSPGYSGILNKYLYGLDSAGDYVVYGNNASSGAANGASALVAHVTT